MKQYVIYGTIHKMDLAPSDVCSLCKKSHNADLVQFQNMANENEMILAGGPCAAKIIFDAGTKSRSNTIIRIGDLIKSIRLRISSAITYKQKNEPLPEYIRRRGLNYDTYVQEQLEMMKAVQKDNILCLQDSTICANIKT